MDLATGINYSRDCNTHISIQPPSARPAKRAPETILIVDGSQVDCNDGGVGDAVGFGNGNGHCGIHVTQYQKEIANDPASRYHPDVTPHDNDSNNISYLTGAEALAIQAVNLYSRLPLVMPVTCQNVEVVPVLFAYGSQSWPVQVYVAHQCNLRFMITETEMGLWL